MNLYQVEIFRRNTFLVIWRHSLLLDWCRCGAKVLSMMDDVTAQITSQGHPNPDHLSRVTDSAFCIRSNCCGWELGWDTKSSQLSRSLDNELVWCQGFPADAEICSPQKDLDGNVSLLCDPQASGISSGLHLPNGSGCENHTQTLSSEPKISGPINIALPIRNR
jgi:hypothetical protein